MFRGGSLLCCSALLLVGCATVPPPKGQRAVTFGYGQTRLVHSGEWLGADDQTTAAISVQWPLPAARWSWDLGLSRMDEESRPGLQKFETRTTEAFAGLRRDLPMPWETLHPYFGFGLAALYTERELTPALGPSDTDEAWSTGVWASAGAWAPFGEHARLGLGLRYLLEEPFAPGDPDLDQRQVLVTLGYGF